MKEEEGREEIQLVVFNLSGEEYGLEIEKAREVIRVREITPLPKADPGVEGIINLRGKIIPVVDLKQRFNLPPAQLTSKSRILIAQVGDELIGIKVDVATEVLKVEKKSVVKPPDKSVAKEIEGAIKGLGKVDERLIILLDIEKVLTKETTKSLKELKEV